MSSTFINRKSQTYYYKSTSPRPLNPAINSILIETDTEDQYRYNQYGRWVLIPPISHNTKRLQTIFIPINDQTGLIFGDATWRNAFAELQDSGNMVYSVKSEAGIVESGYMKVFDFANASMRPKIEVIFAFSETGTNSAGFIGFLDDAGTGILAATPLILDNVCCFGIGYNHNHTNYQVIYNDSSGAVNFTDTGIIRSTDVYKVELSFDTPTIARISLYDINMALVYEDTFMTEIPPTNLDLSFLSEVINKDTSTGLRFSLHLWDFIRLEKDKPALNPTVV